MYNGKCVQECGLNETHSGNAGGCVCISGYVKYNGSCVIACGAHETRNSSGTCVCDGGYEKYNGSCVVACGTNETRNSNGTCVCNTGYEKYYLSCVALCASGLVRNESGMCVYPECPSGQIRDAYGECVAECGSNQTKDFFGNCVCNSGYEDYNGSCLVNCASGLVRDAYGECVYPECDPGKVRNESNECVDVFSFYRIFVDINGTKEGHSKLNEDVFEFWVYLNGTILPAANSIGANSNNFLNASAKLKNGTYIANHVSYKEAACKSGKVDTTKITDYCGSYTVASGCSIDTNNECKLIVHKPGY